MGDEASAEIVLMPALDLSIRTQEDIANSPTQVGEVLLRERGLEEAIFGAAHTDPVKTLKAVMGGLVYDGSVEWAPVRFPKLHRALGRIVVGHKRYYIPKQPIREG